MYAYLRGTFKGHVPGTDEAVILEAGGIGYEVWLPPIVAQEIAASCGPEAELLLHVSAQTSRDQPWPILFGFLHPEQKAFWELLKSVPRVGGRSAARAMAVPIDRIAQAIQDGNRAFLDGLPGITMEGADKMIASLRKRVGPFLQARAAEPLPVRAAPRSAEDEVRADAVELLVGMGLRRPDAQRAVEQVLRAREDITSVQDIITEYFRLQRSARATSG